MLGSEQYVLKERAIWVVPSLLKRLKEMVVNLGDLIFLNNPYVVQSEARLKQAKSRRGKMKKVVDSGFLACDHHVYMSIGVSAAINSKECDEIMIIGLGGGGLCTFLYNCFPKLRITAVEIDEKMLKVATDYFGLILDNRMKVEIAGWYSNWSKTVHRMAKDTKLYFLM